MDIKGRAEGLAEDSIFVSADEMLADLTALAMAGYNTTDLSDAELLALESAWEWLQVIREEGLA